MVAHATKSRSAELYALFTKWCASLRREFDEKKADPPLRPGEPRYAGAAFWASGLRREMRDTWLQLSAAPAGGARAALAALEPKPVLKEGEEASGFAGAGGPVDDLEGIVGQGWLREGIPVPEGRDAAKAFDRLDDVLTG